MNYIDHYASPLGDLTLASDGEALTGLWFDRQKYFGDTLEATTEERPLPVFTQTREWLDLYFHGKEPGFMPPLEMRTTAFRKAVWEILLTIPFGQTMTYGEIAARIAEQRGMEAMSARAVGGAVAHNSISILIPCHRVVGTGGNLTGYSAGLEKKIYLLELEGVDPEPFHLPKGSTAR